MHWKLKAALQNALAVLPPSASYAAYYWVQRRFGALRSVQPVEQLIAGREICKRILEQGVTLANRTFFEVGTGRAPIVPLAYWLMGAKHTITVDLNPYLKAELVREHLRYIRDHTDDIVSIFGPLLNLDRLKVLVNSSLIEDFHITDFFDLCSIEYLAPADAGNTDLQCGSVDFHTSYTVFEHIPKQSLVRILIEGNRIVRDDGLFVHRIDYSDHFSHTDRTISAIDFLRYSDVEWARYAANRYMYMNRLRHDDFIALFDSMGHRMLAVMPKIDERSLELLRRGAIRLSDEFATKSPEVVAVSGAWLVSRKGVQAARSYGPRV